MRLEGGREPPQQVPALIQDDGREFHRLVESRITGRNLDDLY
jgi:hypothetical protein